METTKSTETFTFVGYARNGRALVENQEGQRWFACWHEEWNGNVDDPDYAYCGLPNGHGGRHGNFEI